MRMPETQRALETPLGLFSFRFYCSLLEEKITRILTPSLYIMLFALLKRLEFQPVRRDKKQGQGFVNGTLKGDSSTVLCTSPIWGSL